ncbi:hypothetical protein ACFQ7B_42625 [Streptomyces erythrochromogenes]|uniref:hypothetical protein n=1 Tax=Streptomyces erythrochromogenes TaxID=285574 RepID=UPI0036766519
MARIGYGVLPTLLTVRVIEADVTIALADGTVRCEQWRLPTSLQDATRYPAAELITLYHERWQAETTYFSTKATMLDGRVLRSRSLQGLDQEVYALLTTCQALIRTAADTACTRPGPARTWTASASPSCRPPPPTLSPPRPQSCPRQVPPSSSAPQAGPCSTPCTPPATDTAPRPEPARTPPASTGRTPDNTPRPTRTTPSIPPSRSSNTGLQTTHELKRNGVEIQRLTANHARAHKGSQRIKVLLPAVRLVGVVCAYLARSVINSA